MKLHLTAASLFLASLFPVAALAQEEPIAGKVGSVTFALVVSYEQGGYNGDFYKETVDTSTDYKEFYKSVIVAQKYSTAQFVADLLTRFELPGKASDYSVKYAESGDGRKRGFRGFFLVNKTGTVVQCIGGDAGDNYESDPINTYYVGEYSRPLYNENASTIGKKTGEIWNYTEKSSYNTVQAGTYIYFNPSSEGDEVECFGLVTSGGSSTETYSYDGDDYYNQTWSYTTGETVVSSIVGTDYNWEEPIVLTGSYTVSPLKNTANVNAFAVAFENYYDYD